MFYTHHTLTFLCILCLCTVLNTGLFALDHNGNAAEGSGVSSSPAGTHSINATTIDSLFDRFHADCDVDIDEETGPMSGSCSISMLKTDSVAMTINGPFGILIGRMCASPENLLYFDALKTEFVEADPRSPVLMERLPLPLSYDDFVYLVRNATPFADSVYEVVGSITADSCHIYRRIDSLCCIDFVKRSLGTHSMISYQRKSLKGDVLMNINYSDFEAVHGTLFPRTMVFSFPTQKVVCRLRIRSVSVSPLTEHYSFRAPKGAKVIKLD